MPLDDLFEALLLRAETNLTHRFPAALGIEGAMVADHLKSLQRLGGETVLEIEEQILGQGLDNDRANVNPAILSRCGIYAPILCVLQWLKQDSLREVTGELFVSEAVRAI